MNRTTVKELVFMLTLLALAVGFVLGVAWTKVNGGRLYEEERKWRGYQSDPHSTSEEVEKHHEKSSENAPLRQEIEEKDDAYGLGVDMDQYGRPVREVPLGYDDEEEEND